MNGGRSGVERRLAALVPMLLGVATGIAGNGLFNDFGYRAAAALAAAGGVLAAGLWLRRLPARAPLIGYARGSLLACGLGAAITAAFGPRPLASVATLAAAALTLAALLTTPGIGVARTLFRLALVGLGVALLGTLLRDRQAPLGLIGVLIVGAVLGSLVTIYLLARFHAEPLLAEIEAGEHQVLGVRFLALGGVFGVLAIIGVTGGVVAALAVFGAPALAAFALGVALLKGGRYRVGAALVAVGMAGVVIGVAFAGMPGGLLAGVALIGVGVALLGAGVQRLDAKDRLRALTQHLTGEFPGDRAATVAPPDGSDSTAP